MGSALSMIVFRPPRPSYSARDPRLRWIATQSDCGRIPVMFIDRGAPLTILFSHGNAEDIGLIAPYFAVQAARWHVNVLLYEYSGYGQSGGTASEAHVYRDAEAAFSYLTKNLCIAKSSIVLYGRSLGSGPAVHLAVKNPSVAGLVLQSGLSSIHRVRINPPFTLPGDMFANVDKISGVECPLLVIHGTFDELVSSKCSENVVAAAVNSKSVSCCWIAGGMHNDLEQCHRAKINRSMIRFLAARTKQAFVTKPVGRVSTTKEAVNPSMEGAMQKRLQLHQQQNASSRRENLHQRQRYNERRQQLLQLQRAQKSIGDFQTSPSVTEGKEDSNIFSSSSRVVLAASQPKAGDCSRERINSDGEESRHDGEESALDFSGTSPQEFYVVGAIRSKGSTQSQGMVVRCKKSFTIEMFNEVSTEAEDDERVLDNESHRVFASPPLIRSESSPPALVAPTIGSICRRGDNSEEEGSAKRKDGECSNSDVSTSDSTPTSLGNSEASERASTEDSNDQCTSSFPSSSPGESTICWESSLLPTSSSLASSLPSASFPSSPRATTSTVGALAAPRDLRRGGSAPMVERLNSSPFFTPRAVPAHQHYESTSTPRHATSPSSPPTLLAASAPPLKTRLMRIEPSDGKDSSSSRTSPKASLPSLPAGQENQLLSSSSSGTTQPTCFPESPGAVLCRKEDVSRSAVDVEAPPSQLVDGPNAVQADSDLHVGRCEIGDQERNERKIVCFPLHRTLSRRVGGYRNSRIDAYVTLLRAVAMTSSFQPSKSSGTLFRLPTRHPHPRHPQSVPASSVNM